MTDWNAIRTEYVTTTISLRELANKYGITKSLVAKHCRNEGWTEERTRIVHETGTRVHDAAVENKIQQNVDFLERTAFAMSLVIEKAIEHIENDDRMSGQGLASYQQAVERASSTLREIYHIPTDAEREQRQINLEKWQAEKKKLEADEHKDNTITVILGGDAEEYSK